MAGKPARPPSDWTMEEEQTTIPETEKTDDKEKT
jgi:hypothetical protein